MTSPNWPMAKDIISLEFHLFEFELSNFLGFYKIAKVYDRLFRSKESNNLIRLRFDLYNFLSNLTFRTFLPTENMLYSSKCYIAPCCRIKKNIEPATWTMWKLLRIEIVSHSELKWILMEYSYFYAHQFSPEIFFHFYATKLKKENVCFSNNT